MAEINITIGSKTFKDKADIAKEVNEIDFLTEHLEDKKKDIERNLKHLKNLREIYFIEYIGSE